MPSPILSICRESKGLVRSRAMVAGKEHLVESDTFHIRPVRRSRRFPALFHTDAQNPQGSGKRGNGDYFCWSERLLQMNGSVGQIERSEGDRVVCT